MITLEFSVEKLLIKFISKLCPGPPFRLTVLFQMVSSLTSGVNQPLIPVKHQTVKDQMMQKFI